MASTDWCWSVVQVKERGVNVTCRIFTGHSLQKTYRPLPINACEHAPPGHVPPGRLLESPILLVASQLLPPTPPSLVPHSRRVWSLGSIGRGQKEIWWVVCWLVVVLSGGHSVCAKDNTGCMQVIVGDVGCCAAVAADRMQDGQNVGGGRNYRATAATELPVCM